MLYDRAMTDLPMETRLRSERGQQQRNRAYVRGWLYVVLLVLSALVLVGGATRLTDSGLSITEWKPIHGVIPPLDETEWQEEFAKYRLIPQYEQLNKGMTLDEFKRIFWWEWVHRALARGIGVVFAVPFLVLLALGRVERTMAPRFVGLFLLGGLQGAVGWWMVASGLSERVSVSQYRLAFHLTLACVIYAAIAWIILRMRDATRTRAPLTPARLVAGIIVALIIIQIYLGALVAGIDAGLTYNTWPLIDGAFIPAADRLWFETPWWRNLFENTLMVQFVHRMMAYLLVVTILGYGATLLTTPDRPGKNSATLLAATIVIQAAAGILTLLYQVPLALALLHQLLAIAALTAALVHLHDVSAASSMAEGAASGKRHETLAGRI